MDNWLVDQLKFAIKWNFCTFCFLGYLDISSSILGVRSNRSAFEILYYLSTYRNPGVKGLPRWFYWSLDEKSYFSYHSAVSLSSSYLNRGAALGYLYVLS